MFIRKGEKLGSVLVESAGPRSEPKYRQEPKKASTKKQTSVKQPASDSAEAPSSGWDLTQPAGKSDGEDEKGGKD